MTKAEYIERVRNSKVSPKRIKIINKAYETEINDIVAQIVSLADKVDFFDEERRALSFQEIANPKEQMKYDFVSKGLIPLIDAYDNTYVVYMISEKKWAKYNIVDQVLFKKREKLESVL